MHSLEAEYLELHAAGLIDDADASRAIALERGEIFSVFEEIRFALYAAVAAITTGVGILIKENLDHLGPLTPMATLALAAAICYGTAIRTQLRHELRSTGGDYLLLLGALIMSADLGYAESRFHWLGSHWSWYLLILAILHAAMAYALDSRFLLSLALASLAGWFGVDAHIASFIQANAALRGMGIQALLCASLILLWRAIHERVGGAAPFIDTFEQFAANLGFLGSILLCFTAETRIAGMVILIALAVASIRKGLHNTQEMFVVYGIVYSSIGLYYLEGQIISSALFAAACKLATVIAAVILLRRLRHRARAVAA